MFVTLDVTFFEDQPFFDNHLQRESLSEAYSDILDFLGTFDNVQSPNFLINVKPSD